jgi:hypothetical protein
MRHLMVFFAASQIETGLFITTVPVTLASKITEPPVQITWLEG